MTEDEWLAIAGLRVSSKHLEKARALLKAEAELEEVSQGTGDTALMKLCAAQLFIGGDQHDIAAIWQARQASQDATGAIDAEMLCIGGVDESIAFCAREGLTEAQATIVDRVKTGDLEGFSVGSYTNFLKEYYENEE